MLGAGSECERCGGRRNQTLLIGGRFLECDWLVVLSIFVHALGLQGQNVLSAKRWGGEKLGRLTSNSTLAKDICLVTSKTTFI